MRRGARILCVAGAVLCALAAGVWAQENPAKSPAEVIDRFIRLNNAGALQAREADAILTGEAEDIAVSSFGKLAARPDKIVLISETEAVARVQGHPAGDHLRDFYFFLADQQGWKIRAVRTPFFSEIAEQMAVALRSLKDRDEQEQFVLQNIERATATDAELRAWHGKHREELASVCQLALGGGEEPPFQKAQETEDGSPLGRLLTRLGFDLVSVEEPGQCSVLARTPLGEAAGFLFSPATGPPPMNPASYFWVEPLSEGWFLIRTAPGFLPSTDADTPPADVWSYAGAGPPPFALLAGLVALQETAPGLVLRGSDGSEQSLAALRGKIVVLNFWATWCAPCVEEMPLLERIYQDYAARGVVVVGASADEPATEKHIAPFVDKLKLSFPIWTGATTGDMERFGAPPALPVTVILDRDGGIFARILGPITRQDVTLRLDWLLGPRSEPPPGALVNHFGHAGEHEGHDQAKDRHGKEEDHVHGGVGMEGASLVPS